MREVSRVYKKGTSLFGLVSTQELRRQANSLLFIARKAPVIASEALVITSEAKQSLTIVLPCFKVASSQSSSQ